MAWKNLKKERTVDSRNSIFFFFWGGGGVGGSWSVRNASISLKPRDASIHVIFQTPLYSCMEKL